MTNFRDICGKEIEIGAHVRLTGTGVLPMTVTELGQNTSNGNYYAKCTWFDADGDQCDDDFPVQCLELVSTPVEVAQDCLNNV